MEWGQTDVEENTGISQQMLFGERTFQGKCLTEWTDGWIDRGWTTDDDFHYKGCKSAHTCRHPRPGA